MTDGADDKRDFFVSYNKTDRPWAEWVGSVLERAGYSVFLDVWDFKGNFVAHMHWADQRAERTIALLSDNYFGSDFTLAEWTARFARDPAMREDRLIPIVVGPVSQASLLDPIHHARLVSCGGDEAKGREAVLERIAQATDPDYGTKRRTQPHPFPGPKQESSEPAAAAPRFPVPLHNLPPHNPDFVGREDVLTGLHELLTAGKGPAVLTQAITGLGGIGKTQTALAYAYRHFAEYRLIWWLRAESAATLATDFAALAEPLGLEPMADQEKLHASIRRALQTMDGWLLILDNAEDPALPRGYLPTAGRGQALITSRRTDWQGIAKALEIEVMAKDEAVHLLTGRADLDNLTVDERAEAKALAEELGYLPLALAQARAYMADAGESLAGYRKLLKDSRPAVLESGQAHPDYPASVAKTWQISIDAAEAACPAARTLLELLAFFAPDELPSSVLSGDAMPHGLTDAIYRNKARAALNRLSLIRAEAGTITVHRLVQAVTRDGLDEATAKARAETAVQLLGAAWPGAPWEHTLWPTVGVLLPHALVTAASAERYDASLETAGTLLNNTALYHKARAAYAEAEPLYERAIAICENALGSDNPYLATSLNNLAELYRDTDRNAEAEPLHQRALAIREQALGPEHPDVAQSLNNLAEFYRATGRYAKGEPLYRRTVAILETALGREHPYFAAALNNLAELYRSTGRYADAEPLLERAIAIDEKALGPEHPDLAIDLNNLAKLYWNTGRTAEAEQLYRRAVVILERTLPPGHPNVLKGRENYAELLDDLGRPDEAAALRAKNAAGEPPPKPSGPH